MIIKLKLPHKVQVEITKGSMYGYKLTILKPTQKVGAKRAHTSSDLFFPTTQALAKHLYFLGLEGDSFETLMDNQAKFYTNIGSQLECLFKRDVAA